MKEIPVNQLRVGSIYTEPVYIEEDKLLVPEGIAIRKKDIAQLTAWGIETVYTNGVIAPPAARNQGVKGPPSGEIIAGKGPLPGGIVAEKGSPGQGGAAGESAKLFPLEYLVESVGDQESYRLYTDLINKLDDVFNDIIDESRIDVRAIDTIVDRLLQAIREQPESMLGCILGEGVLGRNFAKSAVNTAILSGLISMEFKALTQKALQIVTGALLHDVGMLRLPRGLLDDPEKLSGIELRQLQTHASASYKIVCKELLYPQGVGMVVSQHHEHWDGTGYPQGLAGTRIDAGARIVAVADAFDAMISKKPYRESMLGHDAMKNLLVDNSHCFDPVVLKAFIKTMGFYPIGSFVLLNNRAIARITEVRVDAPMRPKICLVADESGRVFPKGKKKILDLLNEKKLLIVRALDPRELAK